MQFRGAAAFAPGQLDKLQWSVDALPQIVFVASEFPFVALISCLCFLQEASENWKIEVVRSTPAIVHSACPLPA